MQYKGITKNYQGKYITCYSALYETQNGFDKTYEMISRNPSVSSFEELHSGKADAVIMILHDDSGNKVLLNYEFRMAVGEWVYNFPAGLIDEGETANSAAERELREETGLHLNTISEIWQESYSAVGFSNEKGIVILGTASGKFRQSDSDMEEIHANWYTKAQVRELLLRERFAARTQAYCSLWSKI